jgi:hypothetical protein
MNEALAFRRGLTTRILGVLGAAAIAACSTPGGGAPDGGAAPPDGGPGDGGPDGGEDAMSTGGAGNAGGGSGGSGGASFGGSGGSGGGDGLPASPPVQECFDWASDAGKCPTNEIDVIVQFIQGGCPTGWMPYRVDSPPTAENSECCYMVELILCPGGGRPFLVKGRPRVAPPMGGPESPPKPPGDVDGGVDHDGGAHGWSERALPDLASLTPAERASLAAAWTADALLEHASVASFSRVSLALLAVGAPADLIELTHQAALDEIRHARLCFALATAYAGEDVAPGAFPLGGSVPVATSLLELAVSTTREGCIGETVAAVLAAEQLARATDPAVRAALAQIADDEARHTQLAWRTVAWAIYSGGSEVRDAVEQALIEGISAMASAPPATDAVALEAHGRLDAATTAAVTRGALADVVGPCARALLGRTKPAATAC